MVIEICFGLKLLIFLNVSCFFYWFFSLWFKDFFVEMFNFFFIIFFKLYYVGNMYLEEVDWWLLREVINGNNG